MKTSQLYIHIPFCRRKCLYCDFFSGSPSVVNTDVFIDALLNELSERSLEISFPVSTIYIGGGTPSILSTEQITRLSEGIKRILPLMRELEEFTIEVNPEDVSSEKCKAWKRIGVSRVSVGVQSFNDEELDRIGRRHNATDAENAIRLLKQYFGNVSIDLMFGLPEQTMQTWKQSVSKAISLHPSHISAYSLMLEESTPLTVLHSSGRLNLPDDDETVAMWQHLSDELSRSGYIQYEISNYSLPDKESVHNKGYWIGNQYLGIGPSAHSYDGVDTRRANPSKLKEYIRRYSHEEGELEEYTPYYIEEHLTGEELKEEYIMLKLRMREGIDLSDFKMKFGRPALERLMYLSEKFINDGLLYKDDETLRLTSKGIMKSDMIIVGLNIE